MRQVLLFLVGGMLLVIPAPALAAPRPTSDANAQIAQVCGCVKWFADAYVTTPSIRRTVSSTMEKKGVPRKQRRRTRQAIYDWQKTHDFNSSWCKAHRKACAALYACLGSAGVTMVNSGGQALPTVMRHAAVACAVAAAVVWRSP